jgi:hypothetical protein
MHPVARRCASQRKQFRQSAAGLLHFTKCAAYARDVSFPGTYSECVLSSADGAPSYVHLAGALFLMLMTKLCVLDERYVTTEQTALQSPVQMWTGQEQAPLVLKRMPLLLEPSAW